MGHVAPHPEAQNDTLRRLKLEKNVSMDSGEAHKAKSKAVIGRKLVRGAEGRSSWQKSYCSLHNFC